MEEIKGNRNKEENKNKNIRREKGKLGKYRDIRMTGRLRSRDSIPDKDKRFFSPLHC
jgi:hypothetical protein